MLPGGTTGTTPHLCLMLPGGVGGTTGTSPAVFNTWWVRTVTASRSPAVNSMSSTRDLITLVALHMVHSATDRMETSRIFIFCQDALGGFNPPDHPLSMSLVAS